MKKQPELQSAFLTIPVAAKIIGISPNILRNLIECGLIKALVEGSTIKLSQNQCQLWRRRLQDHDLPSNNGKNGLQRLRPYQPRWVIPKAVPTMRQNVRLGTKSKDYFRTRPDKRK